MYSFFSSSDPLKRDVEMLKKEFREELDFLKNENVLLRKEVEFTNMKLNSITETFDQDIFSELKRLKKDVFYLIQFLHGYGLRPKCNITLGGSEVIKQSIEYWFNKRFGNIDNTELLDHKNKYLNHEILEETFDKRIGETIRENNNV